MCQWQLCTILCGDGRGGTRGNATPGPSSTIQSEVCMQSPLVQSWCWGSGGLASAPCWQRPHVCLGEQGVGGAGAVYTCMPLGGWQWRGWGCAASGPYPAICPERCMQQVLAQSLVRALEPTGAVLEGLERPTDTPKFTLIPHNQSSSAAWVAATHSAPSPVPAQPLHLGVLRLCRLSCTGQLGSGCAGRSG